MLRLTRSERWTAVLVTLLLLAGTGLRMRAARRVVPATLIQNQTQAVQVKDPSSPNSKRSIDPNTAPTVELQALPGIGPVLAQRMVQTRESRPFSSADDLLTVKGIGPATLERIRPFLRFDAP